MATLEPSQGNMVLTSDRGKLAGALDVSPHTGADGLVQGELPLLRLIFYRFHQPCMFPWRIPYCHQ